MSRSTFFDAEAHRLFPLKWRIEGMENYGVAANKKVYKLTTGFEVRQVLKGGYTRGYKLAGKFHSLRQLRLLLRLLT